MNIKEFFRPTWTKLILFAILFYLPSLAIISDFVSGLYTHLKLVLLIVFLIAALAVSLLLNRMKQVSEFLKPNKLKGLVFALLTAITVIFPLLPYLNTNTMQLQFSSFIFLFEAYGLVNAILVLILVLMHLYIYAAIIDLIIRKIKK